MSNFNSDFEEPAQQDPPPVVHDDFISKISQSLPPTMGNWLNAGDKNSRYAKFAAIVGVIIVILLIIFGGILAATYFLGDSNSDTDNGDNTNYTPTSPDNSTSPSPSPITSGDSSSLSPSSTPAPSFIPPPLADGSWPQSRLPTWAKPNYYNISISPSFSDLTFSGSVNLNFQMLEEKNFIVLNSKDITVRSITASQSSKRSSSSFSVKSYTFDTTNENMVINFADVLSPGSYEIYIEYDGILQTDMTGFYYSTYKDNEGREHTIGATQFESTDARKAFPCFDEPIYKSIWDISIETDIKYKVLANMPNLSSTLIGGSIYRFQFQPTPLMSSYLVAFVIGDFACIQDAFGHDETKPIQVCAPIGLEQNGYEALNTAKHVLSFYENYFDEPFTLPKLDMIAIPDFSAGAMENWGLVTYRLTDLLFDEDNDSAYNRQLVATVVAHELAHQWTGDLVTMIWWSDLWLNEGFATYFETESVNDYHEEWLLRDQFFVDVQEVAFNADDLETSHPIVMSGITDTNLIEEVFDGITYEKGGSVLRMIEGIVGYNNLKNGMRNYISKYKFSNANTTQFLQAISEEIGTDLLYLLPFLTTPGYPLVSPVFANNQLNIRQERFFINNDNNKIDNDNNDNENEDKSLETSSFWEIDFSYITDKDLDSAVHVDIISSSTSVSLSSSVRYIKANYAQSGFYRVNYDENNWNNLRENFDIFNNLDRLSIINDGLVLARAGELSTSTALDISKKLKGEEDYVVWKSSLSELYYIGNMLLSQPSYRNYKLFIQDLLSDIVNKIGWEEDSSLEAYDDHVIDLFKNDLFPFALNFHQSDVTSHAWSTWESYKENSTFFILPSLRDTVYRAALYYGGEDDYWTLFNMYQSTSNAAEQRRILRALGTTRDYNLIKYTLDITLDTSIVREQDRITVIAGVCSNPLGLDLAWDFVRSNWNVFNERGFAITNLVTVVTSKFNDQIHLDEVTNFFNENPTNGAQMTVLNCIETIQNNINWLNVNLPVIVPWLDNLDL